MILPLIFWKLKLFTRVRKINPLSNGFLLGIGVLTLAGSLKIPSSTAFRISTPPSLTPLSVMVGPPLLLWWTGPPELNLLSLYDHPIPLDVLRFFLIESVRMSATCLFSWIKPHLVLKFFWVVVQHSNYDLKYLIIKRNVNFIRLVLLFKGIEQVSISYNLYGSWSLSTCKRLVSDICFTFTRCSWWLVWQLVKAKQYKAQVILLGNFFLFLCNLLECKNIPIHL